MSGKMWTMYIKNLMLDDLLCSMTMLEFVLDIYDRIIFVELGLCTKIGMEGCSREESTEWDVQLAALV